MARNIMDLEDVFVFKNKTGECIIVPTYDALHLVDKKLTVHNANKVYSIDFNSNEEAHTAILEATGYEVAEESDEENQEENQDEVLAYPC